MNKDIYKLIEKYFDGDLSVREERELCHRLIELQGEDPLIDEAIAVMGYARHGLSRSKGPAINTVKLPRLAKIRNIAAAAAAVIIMAFGISYHLHDKGHGFDECIAYVGGKRISDEDAIDALIRQQLSEVSEASEDLQRQISYDLDAIRNVMNDIN